MFELSQFPLPYEYDGLAPYMSAKTLECHHGRHVATYIKNLNELITGTMYAGMPLHDIIIRSCGVDKKIFNNAAQVFNHDFFFHCMQRNGDVQIPYEIAKYFGGADKFLAEFKSAALAVFGSGWTWLVKGDDDTFEIISTANADTPIAHGKKPLLTLDVWEHAYYLDWQNRRGEYIDTFFNHLVNWGFVTENMK